MTRSSYFYSEYKLIKARHGVVKLQSNRSITRRHEDESCHLCGNPSPYSKSLVRGVNSGAADDCLMQSMGDRISSRLVKHHHNLLRE